MVRLQPIREHNSYLDACALLTEPLFCLWYLCPRLDKMGRKIIIIVSCKIETGAVGINLVYLRRSYLIPPPLPLLYLVPKPFDIIEKWFRFSYRTWISLLGRLGLIWKNLLGKVFLHLKLLWSFLLFRHSPRFNVSQEVLL